MLWACGSTLFLLFVVSGSSEPLVYLMYTLGLPCFLLIYFSGLPIKNKLM